MLGIIIALIMLLPHGTRIYECAPGKAPSEFNSCQIVHYDILGRFP